MNDDDWQFAVENELRSTVEEFTALALRMAEAVSRRRNSQPGISVTAIDGVPLEAARSFPPERSDQVEELAAGLGALAQSAQALIDPEQQVAEKRAAAGRIVKSRRGLKRFAGDTLSGRDYEPSGPVPTDGFLNLGRLMGRASALLRMDSAAEFPCFVSLAEDFEGEVLGGGAEHFTAGVTYLVERRNDRGSIRVLDEMGRATWVPSDHPYRLIGPRHA